MLNRNSSVALLSKCQTKVCSYFINVLKRIPQGVSIAVLSQAGDRFESSPKSQSEFDEKVLHEFQKIEQTEQPYFFKSSDLDEQEVFYNELEKIYTKAGDLKDLEDLKVSRDELKERRAINNRIKELLKLRAQFNLSQDPEIFNGNFSYRDSLKKGSEELKKYDSEILKIRGRIQINFTPETIDSTSSYYIDIKKMPRADSSHSYIFAAYIYELFHNKPELIEKVLNYEDGLKVVVANRYDKGGSYINCPNNRNTIILNNTQLFLHIGAKKPIVTQHEFVHAIWTVNSTPESGDGFAQAMKDIKDADGNSLMSKFKKSREELFVLYRNYRKFKTKEELAEIIRNQKDQALDPATGLEEYAFENYNEFNAVTCATFYQNPEALKKISPELYAVYCIFFRFDSLKLREKNEEI